MENGTKSVDDIAMAAVNAYFQMHAPQSVTMGYDEVAELYVRAFLDSRKIVQRALNDERLKFAPKAEQPAAAEVPSDLDTSNLDLLDDDFKGYLI